MITALNNKKSITLPSNQSSFWRGLEVLLLDTCGTDGEEIEDLKMKQWSMQGFKGLKLWICRIV
jgi:hypothetical protein